MYELNGQDEFEWGSSIELYFSEAIVSDPAGQGIPVETIGGSIVFSLLGDTSGDGEINVIDVILLVNIILGR